MAGLMRFLGCLGRAALSNSGRALAGLLPFGATAYEIVEDACEQYRREDAPAPAVAGERDYRLAGLLAVGDAADVHLARADADYVLKASRGPDGDALLGNERRTLARLLAAAGDTTYRSYLPAPVDALDASRFPGCVTVFRHEPGLFTLEQLRARYAALDGRHLGWVFNRLLTALGFCHAHGVLHGAVLPCHVQLDPATHGLRLIGWGQSVAVGRPVLALAARYRDWYPPEVRGRRPASVATDLFLAARCLVYLAGGDGERMPDAVPEPMRRFIRGCLLPGERMRPNDAWKLQKEFARLLGRLYGPPKFHHLDMSKGDKRG